MQNERPMIAVDDIAKILLQVYAKLPNPMSHVEVLTSWVLQMFDKYAPLTQCLYGPSLTHNAPSICVDPPISTTSQKSGMQLQACNTTMHPLSSITHAPKPRPEGPHMAEPPLTDALPIVATRGRTGAVPLQSFKIAITMLSTCWLEEKYRCGLRSSCRPCSGACMFHAVALCSPSFLLSLLFPQRDEGCVCVGGSLHQLRTVAAAIPRSQLLACFCVFTPRTHACLSTDAFTVYDTNHDGFITRDQLAEYLKVTLQARTTSETPNTHLALSSWLGICLLDACSRLPMASPRSAGYRTAGSDCCLSMPSSHEVDARRWLIVVCGCILQVIESINEAWPFGFSQAAIKEAVDECCLVRRR